MTSSPALGGRPLVQELLSLHRRTLGVGGERYGREWGWTGSEREGER